MSTLPATGSKLPQTATCTPGTQMRVELLMHCRMGLRDAAGAGKATVQQHSQSAAGQDTMARCLHGLHQGTAAQVEQMMRLS